MLFHLRSFHLRPIFHHKKERIEAHICIAFVAYTVYKELERLLNKQKIEISTAKAIELTKTIYQLVFTLPKSGEQREIFANLSQEQKTLLNL